MIALEILRGSEKIEAYVQFCGIEQKKKSSAKEPILLVIGRRAH